MTAPQSSAPFVQATNDGDEYSIANGAPSPGTSHDRGNVASAQAHDAFRIPGLRRVRSGRGYAARARSGRGRKPAGRSGDRTGLLGPAPSSRTARPRAPDRHQDHDRGGVYAV